MPKDAGHWVKKPFSYRMFQNMTQEEIDQWIADQKAQGLEEQQELIKTINGIKSMYYMNGHLITKDQFIGFNKVIQFESKSDLSNYCVFHRLKSDMKYQILETAITDFKLTYTKFVLEMNSNEVNKTLIDNMLFWKSNNKIIAYSKPFRFEFSLEQFIDFLSGLMVSMKHNFLGNTFEKDLQAELCFSSN